MAMSMPQLRADVSERTGAWLYLDEIMHRVLNDYTAMLSTVRLAALNVPDSRAGAALDDITVRLNAAATSFRALSPPQDALPRDLDEELEALCAALSTSILAKKGVQLTFVADPVQVDAQRCWKICLIVSELVTNAARHAFGTREGGTLVVELSAAGGTIRCTVLDDGAGPVNVIPGRGSAILNAIAAELGGTLQRHHTGLGSTIMLEVPVTAAAGRGTAYLQAAHSRPLDHPVP